MTKIEKQMVAAIAVLVVVIVVLYGALALAVTEATPAYVECREAGRPIDVCLAGQP